MSDKDIHQKRNIPFQASTMTGLSLDDKTKDYLDTLILQVEYNRYMRSHNSGNIHGENFHI